MTADRPLIDLCFDLMRCLPELVASVKTVAIAVLVLAVAYAVRSTAVVASEVKTWVERK